MTDYIGIPKKLLFCQVQGMPCCATDAVVTAEKDGANWFSLIWITPTNATVGMLAAKIGPHTGSSSGLYVPDPQGRHMFNE